MIAAHFYRTADSTLEPRLSVSGWRRLERAYYLRDEADGRSRLALDPDKGFARFSVLISFDPQSMLDLFAKLEGSPVAQEPRGFLVGPYLTPVCTTRHRKTWPSRTRQETLSSLELVLRSIEEVGNPWLRSLRDPLLYASLSDPVAALPAGFAWELAGDHVRARERYEELWRRYQLVSPNRSWRPTDFDKRAYNFIASRLNLSDEHSIRFQRELHGG